MYSYVIEDGSPYMRAGKQHTSSTSGRGSKGEPRDMVDNLGKDVWNFMSFCKKDFVKDSIPDQQLGLQELSVRYKGEVRSPDNLISWIGSQALYPPSKPSKPSY